MNPNCSTCGKPIEDGYSYIAIIEREGRFQFRWACEHKPIGDAAFYIGSELCMLDWLAEHPLYTDAYYLFVRLGPEC